MKKSLTIKNIAHSNPRVSLKKGEMSHYIEMASVDVGCVRSVSEIQTKTFTGSGSKFENGDTIFARITPCLQNGKISKISGIEKCFGSTEFFVFRAIEGVSDPDYLYYLLIHPRVRSIAEGSMVGASGRQRADISHIENIEIEIPESLEEQRRIAAILSVYDDLIENNTKRVRILESMAEELYKEWFVRFRFPGYESVKMAESGTEFGLIPEGWNIGKLGETVKMTMGQSPDSRFYNKSKEGFPFHQGVTNYGVRIPKNEMWCDGPGRIAHTGDILVSVRAPVGRINVAAEEIIIGRGLSAMRHSEGFQTFLLYQLKTIFFKENLFGGWAIFHSVTRNDLETIPVVIPEVSVCRTFDEMASEIDRDLILLEKQIDIAKKARETLIKELF